MIREGSDGVGMIGIGIGVAGADDDTASTVPVGTKPVGAFAFGR